jgi:hypothetical protein
MRCGRMSDGDCHDCGASVKRVIVEGEPVVLDAIPEWNGRYALDPNDAEAATPIASPGRHGYVPHSQKCPAVKRQRASAL